MTKVLMVCLGNICRSPLAEGILKSKIDTDVVFVDSAGTGGYHIGEKADSRSIEVAQNHGLDINDQRSRKFQVSDFETFDHIYVMDQSNYTNVVAQARSQKDIDKVKLLLKEIDLGITEVPDPYYGGADGFEKVYQMVEAACEAIAEKLS